MERRECSLARTLVIGLVFMMFGCVLAQSYPWQDTGQDLEKRVDWLVSHLSLDEKLSLMVHQNPAIEHVGLPAYSWWNEALHGVGRAGVATVYPMPIAMAATFNPPLVRDVFGTVAAEAHAKYLAAQDTGGTGDYTGLTFFTPNINIFRDPRWGRGMETYGEDPYLTARMGLACVEGLQEGHTAACLKHFAVHSGPEGVRHEFDSRVSDYDLRNTYLPAFEYIVSRSQVAQVMCGYNRLNGAPCCTNRRLFDILRREWHYDGILVTDCWALNDAYELDTVIPRHRTHATAALAYGDAFGREVDLECGSGLPALREAVKQGLVPESKVDEHVRRLLRVRLAVTGGDHTTSDNPRVEPLEVVAQSMVLLKNNGVLPLVDGTALRLEGPNMWDSVMPLGNYNGTPRHCVTIGEALDSLLSPRANVVIYAGGLGPQLEGEELQVEKVGFYKGDRTLLELPREQVNDIKLLKQEGYKVVLVVCSGSAVSVENVLDDCDAVLQAWYGGEQMGGAVRDLLLGRRDDFGRLPVTIYRSTSQLPNFEDYSMQGRTYRYMDRKPLFPFGYGLNYGKVALGEAFFNEETMEVYGIVAVDNPVAERTRAVVQVYLDAPDSLEHKRLVGVASVMIPRVHPRVGFRIAIDPFWLRRYNAAADRMEEPADGSAMTLRVQLDSSDPEYLELPFIYHKR